MGKLIINWCGSWLMHYLIDIPAYVGNHSSMVAHEQAILRLCDTKLTRQSTRDGPNRINNVMSCNECNEKRDLQRATPPN